MVIDERNLVMAVKRPTKESSGNKADLTDETEVMYIGNGEKKGTNSEYFRSTLFFKKL